MRRKGFRSEFERSFAHWLIKNDVSYNYEKFYLEYQPKIKSILQIFIYQNKIYTLRQKGFLILQTGKNIC